MITLLLYGCGLGLQPMDKLYTDTGGWSIEPAGEPLVQPSSEPVSDPQQEDNDGDGFSEAEGDCDDDADYISPGNAEIPYDGYDNDCDSSTPDDDLDGDGFERHVDCDDLDDSIQPDAADDVCDGIDNNCNGQADEEAQPDIYEPFDVNTPTHIGYLDELNDSVFAESYLFPIDDSDGFQFWFEDDADYLCLINGDPDRFTCTVYAPSDASIQVDLLWQEETSNTFSPYDSKTISAGGTATFEKESQCIVEDGGTFQFEIFSSGDASCMESYAISCIKDDD